MAGPGNIRFRHATGTRLTGADSKNITSISADGTVTTAAWAVTPVVGEIMEIFGTQPKFNKGQYAVVAATSTTVKLSPKPRVTGTLGTIAKTTQLTAYTLGASNISEVLAFGFDTRLAYVRVAGANFITGVGAGVRRNDRIQIAGSSIANNNGSWIIQEVINDSVLLVRPFDHGTPLTTEAVGTGTIIVRHGRIQLRAENVPAMSWSGIAATALPKKGPYGSSRFYLFGSGSITDYIRINTIGDTPGETRTFVQLEGVVGVQFYQSAPRGSTFYSLDEIVVSTGTSGSTGACNFTNLNTASWPGEFVVELGDNLGNRYSAGHGSAWVGVSVQAAAGKQRVNAYGSYIDGTGINELTLGAGDVTGSIVRPKVNAGTGRVESLIAYGDSGNASGAFAATAAGDQDNITMTKQGTAGASIGTACVIGGLLVSDKVRSVSGTGAAAFSNNVSGGGIVEVRDPRTDLDISDYFSNIASDSEVIKTYQYNPRFVSSESMTGEPVPVFYLTVDVIEINETDLTPLNVIHDTTNTEGRLVGGARFLTRQTVIGTAETSTLFSHRVIVNGAGFTKLDQTIQITAPITGDRAVERIAPDYEGEFGE